MTALVGVGFRTRAECGFSGQIYPNDGLPYEYITIYPIMTLTLGAHGRSLGLLAVASGLISIDVASLNPNYRNDD
ncbi:hypothetical protein IAQ61_005463 [Plenodomus lingam]|uniref:uncharacterized protein n=1 Tax=Leptosphaeria maculans TaxID=5022 RepID=UPI00331C879A|nr:hypothetical protein IAQ61_005463 [Plenodomus lingam]